MRRHQSVPERDARRAGDVSNGRDNETAPLCSRCRSDAPLDDQARSFRASSGLMTVNLGGGKRLGS
jgi:hypothetical protein